MDLKEAYRIIKSSFDNEDEWLLKDGVCGTAVSTLLSFCESVLGCEGIPRIKKSDSEAGVAYCGGWNACHAEWQAYIAKMLNVERITVRIAYELVKNNVQTKPYLSEEIANAIVAEWKEGK